MVHIQRRIVQMAVTPENASNFETVYALGDDGTLFKKTRVETEWSKLPPLPPIQVDVARNPSDSECATERLS